MPDVHPTKKLIFDAIERLILSQGFDAVTFSELSRLCYLQPSGIIYYFKSKDNMLREFFAYIHDRNLSDESLDELIDAKHPVASFCRMVDEEIMSQSGPLSRVLLGYTLSSGDSASEIAQFTSDLVRSSIDKIVYTLERFRTLDIFEPSRYDASLCCFIYSALGYGYLGFIDCQPSPALGEALGGRRLAETLKRSFLKDGLYPPSDASAE